MRVSDESARRLDALGSECNISTDVLVCRILWLLRTDPADFAANALGVDEGVPLGLVLAAPSARKRAMKRMKNLVRPRHYEPIDAFAAQEAVFKWARRYGAGSVCSSFSLEDFPKFWTLSLPGVHEKECMGSILLNPILGDVFVPGTQENHWAEYLVGELLPFVLTPFKRSPRESGAMKSAGTPGD